MRHQEQTASKQHAYKVGVLSPPEEDPAEAVMAASVLVNAPAVVSAVDDAPEAPAPPDALAA